VLEADALTVGLAVWVLARVAEGELAGDADRELAGEGEGEGEGEAEAESGGGAVAELDRGADAEAAGVFVAAALLAVGGVMVLRTASPGGCGDALSCHAVIDPASSRSATPPIAKTARSRRRERPAVVRAAAGRVTEVVAGSSPAAPMTGLSSGWPGSG
jgi:hypothetical protein